MAHFPEDTDQNSWHRYFAIENNNRAWDLAGQPNRSPEESLELLNAAHPAAYNSAQQAIARISDEKDRQIVLQTFNQVPQP